MGKEASVLGICVHKSTYPGRLVRNEIDSVAAMTLQHATEERVISVIQMIRSNQDVTLCSS